jgi:threonine/homoserine/homoserine lactone efflux protein
MDCLTIGLALTVLVPLGLSVLGIVLDMPAMTWGFGYLALIGSIPLSWLLLSKPISRRYGAHGTQLFQRVLTIAALVELSLPVVVFFVTGALAAGSNPAITVPLLFFLNLICLSLFAVWWRRSNM